MAYTYANLMTPSNAESGLAEVMYLAPVSDFAVDGLKCPTAPFTNPGDETRINVPHVFLTGKKFAKILLAPDKNELTAAPTGDKGFKKMNLEVTAFVPGSYNELHEAVKNWLNTPLVVLVPDGNCDTDMVYQLGCKCKFAYIEPTFKSGTDSNGIKGYEFKISYSSKYVQTYDAAIESY